MKHFIRTLFKATPPPADKSAPVREHNQGLVSNIANKRGDTFVETGMKILIAVVIGSLLLTGIIILINKTVLPSAATKIGTLFAPVEKDDNSSGGSSGNIPKPDYGKDDNDKDEEQEKGIFPIKWNAAAVVPNASITISSSNGSVSADEMTEMSNYFCKVSPHIPLEIQLVKTELTISVSKDTWYPTYISDKDIRGAILIKYENGTGDKIWGISINASGIYDFSNAYTAMTGTKAEDIVAQIPTSGFYCINYAKINSGEEDLDKRNYTIDFGEGNAVVADLADNMVVFDYSANTYYANSVETLATFGIDTETVTYSLNGLPGDYAAADNDLVYYGDYKYTYASAKSWVPVVLDNTKVRYAPIAKTLLGKDITTLESTFYDCKSMTIFPQIPESVTTIGTSSFSSCEKLVNVTIPDSVISIGKYAFTFCTGLANITIPDSVTSIDYAAFRYCSSLKGIIIPGSVAFWGDDMFMSCTSLVDVVIQNGVLSVGKNAFDQCGSLKGVALPNSIVSIGDSAFRKCTSLADISIPNGVTSIGQGAFEDCSSLLGISIPNGVNAIKQYTFRNCSNLTSVVIPNSVTCIDYDAFSRCSNLTNVTIPNGVNSIGSNAFAQCSKLTSMTIPKSVTSIDYMAFYNCTGLTSLKILGEATSIGGSAFYGCTGLLTLGLSDGVTSIGDSAFCRCTGLTSITIPESVTHIGMDAFTGCSNVSTVIFANTEGWYVAQNKGDTSGVNMSSADLADPARARRLLVGGTYYDYWYRKA